MTFLQQCANRKGKELNEVLNSYLRKNEAHQMSLEDLSRRMLQHKLVTWLQNCQRGKREETPQNCPVSCTPAHRHNALYVNTHTTYHTRQTHAHTQSKKHTCTKKFDKVLKDISAVKCTYEFYRGSQFISHYTLHTIPKHL